jgi:hypothetical protein
LEVSRFWCVRFRTVLTARMAQTRRIVENDAIRQLCYMNDAPRLVLLGLGAAERGQWFMTLWKLSGDIHKRDASQVWIALNGVRRLPLMLSMT